MSLRSHSWFHLGAAVLQSALLTAAIGIVFTYGAELNIWVVVFASILLGVPALLSIQRSWVKFLWARKLAQARRFAQLNQSSLEAQYELGILEATRGQIERARVAFDAALSILPSHAPSLVGHGHLAAQSGDLSQALDYFERAARIDERLFSAHFGIGTVLQAREQYARSISAFERALELDPTDGPTLAELARNHLLLGNVERAEELFEEAAACGFRDSELDRAIRDRMA